MNMLPTVLLGFVYTCLGRRDQFSFRQSCRVHYVYCRKLDINVLTTFTVKSLEFHANVYQTLTCEDRIYTAVERAGFNIFYLTTGKHTTVNLDEVVSMGVCHNQVYYISLRRNKLWLHLFDVNGNMSVSVKSPGTRVFANHDHVYVAAERSLHLVLPTKGTVSVKQVQTFRDTIVNVTFTGTDIIVVMPNKFGVYSWKGKLKEEFSSVCLKNVFALPRGYVVLTTTGVYICDGQFRHITDGHDVIVFQQWIVVFVATESLELRFFDFHGRLEQTITRPYHRFKTGATSVNHDQGHIVIGDATYRRILTWDQLIL